MKNFNFKQRKQRFEEIWENIKSSDKLNKGALFYLFEKCHSNGLELRTVIEEGKII